MSSAIPLPQRTADREHEQVEQQAANPNGSEAGPSHSVEPPDQNQGGVASSSSRPPLENLPVLPEDAKGEMGDMGVCSSL